VDDIPLNTIRLPYASQYLYFGPQDDLQLEPGWPIDGAYVESRGPAGDIRFTVTAVPSDHGLSRLWYILPEVQYSQDFVGDFRLMDLATAIASHIGANTTCKRLPPGSGSNPTGPAFAGMRPGLHNPWTQPEFLLQQTHQKPGNTFLDTLLCSHVMRLHSLSSDPTLAHKQG
jgi:hypothetical protein